MSISLTGLQHMIAPGTCQSAVKVRVSGHLQSWVGQEEREDLLETLPNVLPDYLYLLVLAFLHLGCGEEWGGEGCGEERVERGVGRSGEERMERGVGRRGEWGGEDGEGCGEEWVERGVERSGEERGVGRRGWRGVWGGVGRRGASGGEQRGRDIQVRVCL